MLEFAEFLTVDPAIVKNENIQVLRDEGWSDEDIVDMVHITSLFNYLVRVADGLGIELPPEREELAEKLSFRDSTAPRSFGDIADMSSPSS